ncbi:MAG: hypothetical protein U0521_16265 [Anaerolineae bacterium]
MNERTSAATTATPASARGHESGARGDQSVGQHTAAARPVGRRGVGAVGEQIEEVVTVVRHPLDGGDGDLPPEQGGGVELRAAGKRHRHAERVHDQPPRQKQPSRIYATNRCPPFMRLSGTAQETSSTSPTGSSRRRRLAVRARRREILLVSAGDADRDSVDA